MQLLLAEAERRIRSGFAHSRSKGALRSHFQTYLNFPLLKSSSGEFPSGGKFKHENLIQIATFDVYFQSIFNCDSIALFAPMCQLEVWAHGNLAFLQHSWSNLQLPGIITQRSDDTQQ